MADKVAPAGAQVTAGGALAWVFGVLFTIAGLVAVIGGEFAFGIPLLLAGLILLPVVRAIMRELVRIDLPSWLVGIIVVLLIVLSIVNTPRVDTATPAAVSAAPTTVRCTTGEIVNASSDCPARTISYDELMRNSGSYVGARVKYTGEVVQVSQRADGTFMLRVDVTKKGYVWSDTVWVEYAGQRVLENDLITFTGTFDGLTTYRSVLGNEVTLPNITADAVTVSVKAGDR